LPDPIPIASQREFVRETLAAEVDLRADGPRFVAADQEPERTLDYRRQINAAGSPSTIVAAGYRWRPGTELRAWPSQQDGSDGAPPAAASA
jgi:hypothetical protein